MAQYILLKVEDDREYDIQDELDTLDGVEYRTLTNETMVVEFNEAHSITQEQHDACYEEWIKFWHEAIDGIDPATWDMEAEGYLREEGAIYDFIYAEIASMIQLGNGFNITGLSHEALVWGFTEMLDNLREI